MNSSDQSLKLTKNLKMKELLEKYCDNKLINHRLKKSTDDKLINAYHNSFVSNIMKGVIKSFSVPLPLF